MIGIFYILQKFFSVSYLSVKLQYSEFTMFVRFHKLLLNFIFLSCMLKLQMWDSQLVYNVNVKSLRSSVWNEINVDLKEQGQGYMVDVTAHPNLVPIIFGE